MALDPISASITSLLSPAPVSVKKPEADEAAAGIFSDMLKESFETARATDASDKISSIELLSGQTDDMSGLLLDAQKAEIALNLALQIRNKVLDAYNDIIRMQV
ncbi:MAG: flagellar hook-basal body complex protein FliE [Oscillospiraceae bacterium]|jgi:flagellar hook-basal body complex protein FliE|nr:flagellar hook-basal body complex protein FliE [Oscillospiraceae bacterium]